MVSRAAHGHRSPLIAGVVAGALLASACGGSGEDAPARPAVSPAPTRAAGPATSPVATRAPAGPGPALSTPAPDDTPATRITLGALDNAFERPGLRVPAGEQVTLTLENRGAALHDWQVLGVADVAGAPIKTPLLAAGQTATIQFTIDRPGSYAFYCEVHPVEMRGTLAVQ